MACALALMGSLVLSATAMGEPQRIAELALHAQPSQSKWLPDQKPLFGDYLASGDGNASGALVGKIAWDLYEEMSNADHHPAHMLGFLEREGKRYPFEIIGLYTPESADRRQWRITGAITFADSQVLGMKQASLIGTFEAATSSAKYTIWAND